MTDLVDEFCFKLLNNFMNHEVSIYRNNLGFHFDFDFKYMLFVRSTNEVQNKLYGPGIRVRHNLFDSHLYSICVDEYLNIKKNIYEINKEEIKKCIREFNHRDYSLLIDENDKNEFNVNMSKYYQIFIILNQDKIIKSFEESYN